MPGRLENKVVLVTGAGSELSREMAVLFASEGAIVVVNDIDADAGERTTSEVGRRGHVRGGRRLDRRRGQSGI